MFKILDFTKDNLTAIQVEGTVTREDYEKLNALFEKNEVAFCFFYVFCVGMNFGY